MKKINTGFNFILTPQHFSHNSITFWSEPINPSTISSYFFYTTALPLLSSSLFISLTVTKERAWPYPGPFAHLSTLASLKHTFSPFPPLFNFFLFLKVFVYVTSDRTSGMFKLVTRTQSSKWVNSLFSRHILCICIYIYMCV